jgi:hypothetical protein
LLLYDVALKGQSRHQTLTGVLLDDDFNTMLARMQSRNILVILDACHSGSATRSLRLNPRSISVNDAQVKYFSYSPYMGTAGGGGSFDVLEAETSAEISAHYVAITACRDDEKTTILRPKNYSARRQNLYEKRFNPTQSLFIHR